ncbi:MAG: putative O-methyltransferase [Spartobacteria bacterium]|nr:putative O-methyltransferase [Spartobacteria bacterium]
MLLLPARSAIRRMLAQGVPANLATPLNYLAWPIISSDAQRILNPIDRSRAAMAKRTDDPPFGFDSPRPQQVEDGQIPTVGPTKVSPWTWLATHSSVTLYWGTFLYLCAKHTRAQTILELGGCAGISACYLSSGNSGNQLITVEGSPGRAAVAEANLRAINPSARVVNVMFDDALDEWLPKLSGKLDLVHIDGQHNRVSTLHYFERVKPHLRRGALVIFDDIHWSDDMRRAWNELSKSRGLSHSIDVGRYGICVLADTSQQEPRVYNFSRYAMEWRDQNEPRLGRPHPEAPYESSRG